MYQYSTTEYTPSCSCMDMKPDYLKEKHSLSYEIGCILESPGNDRSGAEKTEVISVITGRSMGNHLKEVSLFGCGAQLFQDDEVTARRFTGIGKGLAYQILKSSLM